MNYDQQRCKSKRVLYKIENVIKENVESKGSSNCPLRRPQEGFKSFVVIIISIYPLKSFR